MRSEKFLKSELSDLEGFLNMIEAYEEISAIRMRKVKKSVLSRREFLQGLNEAFSYVIYSYGVYRKSLKKKQSEDIFSNNGRNVLVLLSSNTGLYGDIILRTFAMFIEEVKDSKDDTDVVLTGRLGKRLYDKSGVKKPYKYFEMADTASNDQNIKNLLDYITEYNSVSVYHGVFKSILVQEPRQTYLTGELLKIQDNVGKYRTSFIFEPSVEKVAKYFERQISSLIFEQSVFESGLSKFASRMVSLDTAASNISMKSLGMGFEFKKAKHKKTSSSIQENILGSVLWT